MRIHWPIEYSELLILAQINMNWIWYTVGVDQIPLLALKNTDQNKHK